MLLWRPSELHHEASLQSSKLSAPQHLNVVWRSSTASVVRLCRAAPYSDNIDTLRLVTSCR